MKKCRDVMTGHPICCVPTDTAARVAKLMKKENIGAVPICEDRHGSKLVGIITDRDLTLQVVAECLNAGTTKLQDLMTRRPFTCHPDDDLQKALGEMEKHQVRRIPVVDDDGQLIGIISQADIATRGDQPEKTAEVVVEISRASWGGGL
jgi:CBS domain-containing protein